MLNCWTSEETTILKNNYSKLSNERLADLLPNKTPLAIYKKAYSLGMRKTKENEFLNRSLARKGEKSSNWKGGIKTSRKGYRLVLKPEHSRADPNGYVFEHILVFEKAVGITIPKGCCIHHLNGNKADNRIENLCLMAKSAHTILHNKKRKEG